MATTAAFGSLAIPQPEDSMDMSSPNRHDHEDIDIDFDDFAAADVPVDDAMVDENEPHTLPFPDADMDDASHQDAIHTLEEDMSDEIDDQTALHNQHAAIEEDELIDYDDEDWTGEAQPAEDSPVTSSVAVEPHAAAQPTTNTDSRDVGTIDIAPGGKLGEAGSHLQQSAGAEAYSPSTNGAVVLEHHTEQKTAQPDVVASSAEHDAVEGHASGEEADKGLKVESTLTDETQTEDPSPSTDTGLHPVTIRFRGDELPLFRSKSQPNGLLTDDNLCHVSLSELMDHCKHSLSERYDQSVSSDQEAVLGFASLPLVSLSETCRSAFDQSLHDVLEVYVNLCSNDTGSENHPLALTFSLQYKFSSSLELFKQMAEHGKGYSDVPGVPLFLHEHEEAYEENYDEYNEDESGDHEHGKNHYEFTVESNERGEGTADGEIAHVKGATDVAEVNHDDSHGAESKPQKLPAENASEQEGTSIEQGPTENGSDDNRIMNARDVPSEAAGQGELQPQAEINPSQEAVTIGSGSGSPRKVVENDSIPAPTEHTGDDTTNAEVPSTKNTEETADDVHVVDNKGQTGTKTGDDASGNTENEELGDETLAVADEESGDGAEAASINDPLVEPDLDTGSLDESHDDIPFDLSPTDTTAVEQLEAETQTVLSEGDADTGKAQSPEILAEIDEDTIDFDDETTEQYEARTRERSQPGEVPSSPTGKRSFSGYADEDVLEFDDDEPDPKKTRSQ